MLIDALPYAGGQCMELYADKPIYDIPGTPVTTGRGLSAKSAAADSAFSGADALSQLVESVTRLEDGRLHLVTDTGNTFVTKTLFVAAGVGAFVARKPPVPALEAFEGRQVHLPHNASAAGWHHGRCPLSYWVAMSLPSMAALDAAQPSEKCRVHRYSVTLIHRRDVFRR